MKHPPTGFTNETWEQFARDGLLIVPDALTTETVDALKSQIQSMQPDKDSLNAFNLMNIVEMHPLFSKMIDHASHIGYIYDVYGESTKLLLSQLFLRPSGSQQKNDWHFDGPRQVPFQVFSTKLPLRIKVGYWLTDLTEDSMGNLVFIRGSHRVPHLDQYKTHEVAQGEERLKVKAGTMILMHEGLWHRVDDNTRGTTRVNLFYEYGPAWITASDRWRSNLSWLATLTREQRILMRDCDFPNALIKPSAEDVPLFSPRKADDVSSGPNYREHVPMEIRKFPTWLEQKGYA